MSSARDELAVPLESDRSALMTYVEKLEAEALESRAIRVQLDRELETARRSAAEWQECARKEFVANESTRSDLETVKIANSVLRTAQAVSDRSAEAGRAFGLHDGRRAHPHRNYCQQCGEALSPSIVRSFRVDACRNCGLCWLTKPETPAE